MHLRTDRIPPSSRRPRPRPVTTEWRPPAYRSQRDALVQKYRATRALTESLAASLSAEDQQVQSMPDCSPTKWHRAHTTWFFETFVLAPRGFAPVRPEYSTLFNSYYDSVGPRHPRAERGLLSRPSVHEIAHYREQVDECVIALLLQAEQSRFELVRPIVELGVAHEQQHQELLLTDILNAFSLNPSLVTYAPPPVPHLALGATQQVQFVDYEGGLVDVGSQDGAFAFDNEGPRHKVWLEPFALANRLVTVEEWKAFVRDRGYETPSLWLSEGFDFVQRENIRAPLYGRLEDGELVVFGLHGERRPANDEPISHLSFYEADALARYLGARLPDEAEWELAASEVDSHIGNYLDSSHLYPTPLGGSPLIGSVAQLFGDVWEWTRSPYVPYPGYVPQAGALGEYNGKFMSQQMVLRGGSCLTPHGHLRASYRNFWPPQTRFQMSGLRLAKDRTRGEKGKENS